MTRKENPRNSVSVTGGTHVGGTIGAGKVDSHAEVRTRDVGGEPIGTRPATVTDLRSMIEAARGHIVGSAATEEQRADLAYELRKILEELGSEDPQPAPVRERWKTVRDVLGALAGSGAIAAITELVTSIFGSD